MNCHSISSFVSKAYRRLPVDLESFQRFTGALSTLLDVVCDSQQEEEQKSNFKKFLTDTFYGEYYIAPEGTVDMAIHNDRSPKSGIGVLVEVKRTSEKSGMVSPDNLNRKALQELLLYYLRERVTKRNTDLKYLVITNIKELFIFDAQEFERRFYADKSLVAEFKDFERKSKAVTTTEGFYKEIASRYIGKVQEDLQFTYINLFDYQKYLHKSPEKSAKLIGLYKALSDKTLLKKPLQNDSNTLNRGFYNELLHIIGVTEKKKGNKVVIVRNGPSDREAASLIENTMSRLESMNCLYNLDKSDASDSDESRLFDVAMELCITWINRIVFLKLLEAQLVKYHGGDSRYRFLTTEKIKCFNDLDTLFFKVVACDYDKRDAGASRGNDLIPYLNSSLFEVTDLEKKTLRIGNLTIRESLPLFRNSVLRHSDGVRSGSGMSCLEYLLLFLDSYDFASEDDETVKGKPKTLINASVLGLIFEKINGHKDGAVFTPGHVTMYMCREALTSVVVRRFNERYGWNLTSYGDLLNKDLDIREANEVINGIRLCDPSVGSGHFLVSALNEIIRIKFELGILTDRDGLRIKAQDYSVTVENDELIVMNSDGTPFCYNPKNKESRRVQETLFNEKRTIIENSLFGVDINPNSANICRLRLWIELLKNTYYTEPSGFRHLETLPNIDINIRHGNSLVRRFPIDSDLSDALRHTGVSVGTYRQTVERYKSTSDKKVKHELSSMIAGIKGRLDAGIKAQDKDLRRLKRLEAQVVVDETPIAFDFYEDTTPQRIIRRRIAESKREIDRLRKKIEGRYIGNDIGDAFEWRFEFPEILDNDGGFLGFDLVIGNPPYIQLQTMHGHADALQKMGYETFVRTGDVYCLFYELGISLLRDGGLLSFITSNKWMKADYGSRLRGFITSHSTPVSLVDFGSCQIFDEVSVGANILTLGKGASLEPMSCCTVRRREDVKNLEAYVSANSVSCRFDGDSAWAVLSPIESVIRCKIENRGTKLGDMDVQINLGIKTGLNDAFLITSSKREEILSKCRDEEERNVTDMLIRPILRGCDIRRYATEWADRWLINVHNGVKGRIEPVNIEDYPALKSHLDLFIEELSERRDKGDTPYNLRNCAYIEDFAKPKIVWLTITDSPKFTLDTTGAIALNSSYIMTGENLEKILVCLNSKLIRWYFSLVCSSTGEGTAKWEKFAVEQIPVADITADAEHLTGLIARGDYEALERIVEEAYGLNEEEMEYIANLYQGKGI